MLWLEGFCGVLDEEERGQCVDGGKAWQCVDGRKAWQDVYMTKNASVHTVVPGLCDCAGL
jgi:hypothetical protein